MSDVSTKKKVEKPVESDSVEAPVMRKADGSSGKMDSVQSAFGKLSGSSGSPLPNPIQRKFESSLGADLSSVRVHTGSASAQAASAVSAKAFATGQDIHFNSGQYNPGSQDGEKLLAHEVAHTVQQSGGSKGTQFKLNVSQPGDALEVEADRAADAMVSGESAAVSAASFGIHRDSTMVFEDDQIQGNESLEDKMRQAAENNQKAVEESGSAYTQTATAGAMKLGSLSSVETTAQARSCIQKVTKANANLFQRYAVDKANHDKVSGRPAMWKEAEAAEKKKDQTQGFIDKNEGVINNLQGIVDLAEGNSQTDESGNRPGHNLQLQVFSQLAEGARQDFARLEGVVTAFMEANDIAMSVEGSAGGRKLGTAVATGNATTNPDALKDTKTKVADSKNVDTDLADLLETFKGQHKAFENADYQGAIDSQLSKCAGAVSEAKNIHLDVDYGKLRPDTPEQTKAKADVAKVKADLNAAKSALGKTASIGKLAVSVMTGPVGMTAAGMTAGLSEAEGIQNALKAKDTASKISKGGATATGTDVEKAVSEGITSAVAKMMTNYTQRMNAANGKVKFANDQAAKKFARLDENRIKVAEGNIKQEFKALSKICFNVERDKAQMRETVNKIDERQKTLEKRGKKTPDLAGMTRALGECTAYVEQAKAAITQGEAAQKTAKEIQEKREAVAGKMKKNYGKDAAPDMSGEAQVAKSAKEDAYIDCEPTAPFLLSQHPLEFRIRSKKYAGLDDNANKSQVVKETLANKSTDVAAEGVQTALDALKADLEVAQGFQSALKTALNM